MPQLSVIHSMQPAKSQGLSDKTERSAEVFLKPFSSLMVPLYSIGPHQLHLEEKEGQDEGWRKNREREWDAGMRKRKDCSLVFA